MDARCHRLVCALMGLGLATVAGCDGIVEPPWWTHQMVMYAPLNPDFTEHPILLVATDHESTLSQASITIHRRVHGPTGDEWELVASWDSAQAAAAGRPLRDYGACMGRMGKMGLYNEVRDKVCMTPEAALEPGAVYRVEARALDRDTASGVTRVVGAFEVEDAVLSGADNSAVLSASWTPSLAVHRYIVSFRSDCYGSGQGCDPWHADVDTAAVSIGVPEYAIGKALTNPMTLDVVAFDEHLHAFLTTGHDGIAFDVPPVQNVEGGFGVVGSLQFRERAVTR